MTIHLDYDTIMDDFSDETQELFREFILSAVSERINKGIDVKDFDIIDIDAKISIKVEVENEYSPDSYLEQDFEDRISGTIDLDY